MEIFDEPALAADLMTGEASLLGDHVEDSEFDLPQRRWIAGRRHQRDSRFLGSESYPRTAVTISRAHAASSSGSGGCGGFAYLSTSP